MILTDILNDKGVGNMPLSPQQENQLQVFLSGIPKKNVKDIPLYLRTGDGRCQFEQAISTITNQSLLKAKRIANIALNLVFTSEECKENIFKMIIDKISQEV